MERVKVGKGEYDIAQQIQDKKYDAQRGVSVVK